MCYIRKLYDLDGKKYTNEDTMTLYVEALTEFKKENPTFIGSKFIYAPNKATAQVRNLFDTASYFETVQRLHNEFPEFLAGFDLVGQEDRAPPLLSLAASILQLPDSIKLYFHAGETNWFGSIDENLVIDHFH